MNHISYVRTSYFKINKTPNQLTIESKITEWCTISRSQPNIRFKRAHPMDLAELDSLLSLGLLHLPGRNPDFYVKPFIPYHISRGVKVGLQDRSQATLVVMSRLQNLDW